MRPRLTCCLTDEADEIEAEPDAYDCETCPVREAVGALWPENIEAWRLFQVAVTRFSVDLHLVGEIVRRLTAHIDDAEDAAAVLTRLSLIYEWLYPPPAKPIEDF